MRFPVSFVVLCPLPLAFGGCLLDRELYESRHAELADQDGDGVQSLAAGGLDCDDTDPTVFPGAQESCNGKDDDCDGVIDDDATDRLTWYRDQDGDGYGDLASDPACTAPAGHVADSGDCDDADPDVYLGAPEVPYDGVDNDCVGGDAVDVDGDGYDAVEAGGDDCDDGDAAVNPGGEDTWLNGGRDFDCDGSLGAPDFEYGADAWTGPSAGALAGLSVGSLGDVTGDGVGDFLVGAPFDGTHHEYGGAVFLVEGGEPVPLSAEARLHPQQSDVGFGIVEVGADFTGDGTPEFAVAGSLYQEGAGKVWLFAADGWATDGPPAMGDALGTIEGNGPAQYAGTEVAFPGDLDGDGLPDIVVGTSGADSRTGLAAAGVVDVWAVAELGTETVGGGSAVIEGYYAGARYGSTVEPAGDVDGDGYPDILIGAASGDFGAIVPGGSTPVHILDDALIRVTAEEDGQQGRMLMVGDMDGDGSADLACRLAGDNDVLVYTDIAFGGARTASTAAFRIGVEQDWLVESVIPIDDIDGDDQDETMVVVHNHGPTSRGFAAIIPGSEYRFGGAVNVDDAPLVAWSTRFGAGLGYRAVLADDVTGDGHADVLLGGPWDSYVGENAGAVVALPVPL